MKKRARDTARARSVPVVHWKGRRSVLRHKKQSTDVQSQVEVDRGLRQHGRVHQGSQIHDPGPGLASVVDFPPDGLVLQAPNGQLEDHSALFVSVQGVRPKAHHARLLHAPVGELGQKVPQRPAWVVVEARRVEEAEQAPLVLQRLPGRQGQRATGAARFRLELDQEGRGADTVGKRLLNRRRQGPGSKVRGQREARRYFGGANECWEPKPVVILMGLEISER
jgi:hypothetical protein